MSLALRIITLQAGCVLAAGAILPLLINGLGLNVLGQGAVGTAAISAALLLGGFCVVIPSALYAWITRREHRPGRLLGYAQVKLLVTIVLLALAMALGVSAPLWVLAGMVAAYVAHGLGAFLLA